MKDKNSMLNKYICEYIANEFFKPFKDNNKEEISLNLYAKNCNLSSSTISKINEGNGYNIPFSTIYNILRYENVSLEVFFSNFEKTYPNIPN